MTLAGKIKTFQIIRKNNKWCIHVFFLIDVWVGITVHQKQIKIWCHSLSFPDITATTAIISLSRIHVLRLCSAKISCKAALTSPADKQCCCPIFLRMCNCHLHKHAIPEAELLFIPIKLIFIRLYIYIFFLNQISPWDCHTFLREEGGMRGGGRRWNEKESAEITST